MTGGLSVVRCRSDALRSIISRRNASVDGIAQPRAGGVPPVSDGPAGRGGRRSVSFASLHARRETGWNKIVRGPVRCSRGFAALRSSDAPGPRRLARPLSRSASAALRAAWPGSAARLRRAARGLAGVRCSPPPRCARLGRVRCSPPPRCARLGRGPLLASAALRAAWPGPLLASAALRAAWPGPPLASAALHAAWPGPLLASAALHAAWPGSAARLRRAARGLAGLCCSPPPRRARLGGAPLLAFAALRAAWPGPLLASAALRAAGGD